MQSIRFHFPITIMIAIRLLQLNVIKIYCVPSLLWVRLCTNLISIMNTQSLQQHFHWHPKLICSDTYVETWQGSVKCYWVWLATVICRTDKEVMNKVASSVTGNRFHFFCKFFVHLESNDLEKFDAWVLDQMLAILVHLDPLLCSTALRQSKCWD